MKLNFAFPILGALALFAALPDRAQARSRSSFDISVGFGYSNYGGYRSRDYYDTGVSLRYSTGGYRGYRGYRGDYYDRPRTYYAPRYSYYTPRHTYYAPRVVYRPVYVRPAPRYYYSDNCDYTYSRPVYRTTTYYRDYGYDYDY